MPSDSGPKRASAVLIALITIAVLGLANAYRLADTTLPHFAWQAQAFLAGRLDLIPNDFFRFAPIVQDMVFRGGKFYWPLGPLPAILLVPAEFAQLLPAHVNQKILQALTVIATAAVAYLFAKRSGHDSEKSWWLTLAFLFGSMYIGIAGVYGSWYLAQTVAVLLVMMALLEYRGADRPWLIGILCGLTMGCRPVAGAALALFYGLVTLSGHGLSKKMFGRALSFAVPVAICLLALGWFNWARFGSPFDNGYQTSLLAVESPEGLSLSGRRTATGLFDPSYVVFNFKHYLLALPFQDNVVNPLGLSLFVIAPVFIWIAALRRWKPEHWAAAAVSLAAFILFLFYYTTGFAQLGPRYLNDVLPFLFLLLLAAMQGKNIWGRWPKVVIGLSLLLNVILLQGYALERF